MAESAREPSRRLGRKSDRTVLVGSIARDYRGIFNRETIERYVSDSFERLESARIKDFVPVLAERFVRDRLRALAKVRGLASVDTPAVLFLCAHNAGRSQITAGLLKAIAGDRVAVYSAGSAPGPELNEAAVAAMREVRIDITQEFPKPWTDEVVEAADVVVTMGCGDSCPIYPATRYIDWDVADPSGQDIDTVRALRNDIRARVETLARDLGVAASSPAR